MDHVSTRSTGTAVARTLDPSPSTEATATAAGVAVDLNNSGPLDERHAGWLDTLQGNILRGHGRSFGVYLQLRLPADAAAARQLVIRLTKAWVTSARRQFADWDRHRRFGIPGGTFGTLALSASGYARLGTAPDHLFPPPPAGEQHAPPRSLFAAGMHASRAALGDVPGPWTAPYGAHGSIDAMLTLAHNDRDALLAAAAEAFDTIEGQGGRVVGVEHGGVLRNEKNEGIEHFGFVDGRSQPQYVASDKAKGSGVRPATDQWDPFEPLRRVLVRDPGTEDARCHGSFLVLRKLDQNVKRFREQLLGVAQTLGLHGNDEARVDHAGALVVGRFRDGTPIVQQDRPGGDPAQANNFTYQEDVRGGRCPLHAHIRKVNPRGHSVREGETSEVERRHGITRRSMTYGERRPDETADSLPEKGVGVLFMCYQASIEDQFAFMQKDWCNTAWFPQAYVGVDALAGLDDERELRAADAGGSNDSHQHLWPEGYGRDPSKQAPFASCVTTLGGEFFFVPSLPFLLRTP